MHSILNDPTRVQPVTVATSSRHFSDTTNERYPAVTSSFRGKINLTSALIAVGSHSGAQWKHRSPRTILPERAISPCPISQAPQMDRARTKSTGLTVAPLSCCLIGMQRLTNTWLYADCLTEPG